MAQTTPVSPLKRPRILVGLVIVILGVFLCALGAKPQIFGLDRSSVIGFVQIAVFLSGLGFICVGGYLSLAGLWNGFHQTIASDIGQRLVSTGFVISVACGMADVFGFGNEIAPRIPNFGIWQTFGVVIGEVVIGIGFLLLIPYHPVSTPKQGG